MVELRVLSLDISASCTGWAFMSTVDRNLVFGNIKTSPKLDRQNRLVYFRNRLKGLVDKLKPTHIVIEDVYLGPNPKTLVLLSKFAGVTEECCLSEFGVTTFVIQNQTTKSYFKVKKKDELFDVVNSIIEDDSLNYKKHNDVTDAIAQLICFMDSILDINDLRVAKSYGYLYEVDKWQKNLD